jgi:MFS family permease
MGMLPEHFLHAYGTPRTHWLLATFTALSATILATAAAAHPSHLYLLSLAVGLSYGAVFSLIPAIAADVFGLRHFAATYSGLQTACAIGCYVFPTQLAGAWPIKAAVVILYTAGTAAANALTAPA